MTTWKQDTPGCQQVCKLAIYCFCNKFGLSNVVVIEEGILYIGKYDTNLTIITLTNCGGGHGESLSHIVTRYRNYVVHQDSYMKHANSFLVMEEDVLIAGQPIHIDQM
jgi:hypothetical protein